LPDIEKAYAELTKYTKTKYYYLEGLLRGCEIIGFAGRFENLYNEYKKENPDNDKISKSIAALKSATVKYFKDYDAPTDQKLLAAMLEMFYNDVPKEFQPAIFSDITKKYKNDFNKCAADIFAKSLFTDQKRTEAFLANPGKKLLEKDPAFKMMLSVMRKYHEVNDNITMATNLLGRGNRLFVAGLKEMDPNKKYYPNANSTMRLTYGKVLDYNPADAVHYNYYTTLKGIMDKEDTTSDEFIVPAKLKQLYKNKDYGRYAENGEMKVCFLTDNDITGGNSGSPVINGDGQLLGLAFDGNWEAMANNIVYNPELQRTICVDIRYVLFIIDKYAGATNLINEMNLVEKPVNIGKDGDPTKN
jgi:hypothetical protein